MKALALVLLLCAPARGWWWSTLIDPLKQARAHFEAGLYRQVVIELNPAAVQKLRGEDLRRGYLLLGESHERLGSPDKALGVYQVAVKLFPRNLELLTRQASLLHAAGLNEQAEPLYAKVLSIHPNNTLANLGLAEIDHALGFLDRSAERYEKALQEDLAEKPYIWRDYAEVLYEQRDYVTAQAAIDKALSLAPDEDSSIVLAFIQRAQGQRPKALETLAALAPKAELDRLRALWLMEENRHAEALPLVEGLLKAGADDPLARYLSARLHLKAGRREAALKDLEAASAGGKTARFTAEVAEAMLKRLRDQP